MELVGHAHGEARAADELLHVHEILAAVRGEAPPPPLEEQVIVQRVIEAIYRSAADGRDVTL